MNNASKPPSGFFASEDAWATVIAFGLLLVSLAATWPVGAEVGDGVSNALGPWITKPGSWDSNALRAVVPADGRSRLPGIVVVMVITLVSFSIATRALDRSRNQFVLAFPCVFLLATLAFVLASQSVVNHYGLSYALWALLLGLIISNTVGTPELLRRGDQFPRTGETFSWWQTAGVVRHGTVVKPMPDTVNGLADV